MWARTMPTTASDEQAGAEALVADGEEAGDEAGRERHGQARPPG